MTRKIGVIDPGHDIEEPGSTQVDGESEYKFTLALCQAVKADLAAHYDCEIHLTHETPAGMVPGPAAAPELYARGDLANKFGADWFLSIHHNAGPAAARGAELYIWTALRSYGGRVTRDYPAGEGSLAWLDAAGRQPDGTPNHDAQRSMAAAQLAQPIIQEGFAALGIPWHGAPIKAADFAVLRYPQRPCMLLETHYGTNAQDDAIADRPETITAMAHVIAQALAAAFGLTELPVPWKLPTVKVRIKATGVDLWGELVNGVTMVTLPEVDQSVPIRPAAKALGLPVKWIPNPPTVVVG